MTETSGSQDISTKLQRIAKLAKEIRGATLKTLAHHIDVDWLREAYRRTRKDGAPGVDGVPGSARATCFWRASSHPAIRSPWIKSEPSAGGSTTTTCAPVAMARTRAP